MSHLTETKFAVHNSTVTAAVWRWKAKVAYGLVRIEVDLQHYFSETVSHTLLQMLLFGSAAAAEGKPVH